MKHAGRRIVLPILLFALGVPAISPATQFGCFDCADEPGPASLGSFCQPAYEGAGWICNTYHAADGFDICWISGGACLNPDFGGGGGGGGTGSGGGSCSGGGFCPAACFSCGGGGGGLAI
jgi:hypothetical protein